MPSGCSWTWEEDDILIRKYSSAEWDELFEELPGRSREAMYNHAAVLKVKREVRKTPKNQNGPGRPLLSFDDEEEMFIFMERDRPQKFLADVLGCKVSKVGYYLRKNWLSSKFKHNNPGFVIRSNQIKLHLREELGGICDGV